MIQNRCNETITKAKYSPYGPAKFPLNIPNDPRKKCRGCGESIIANKNADTKTTGRQAKGKKAPTKYGSTTNAMDHLSSSESSLSFLQARNSDMQSRTVRYQGQAGTSFGAHLLRKSKPLLSDALDEKLKFKRDSDAGNIVIQQRRKITRPFFINEIDSEDMIQFRDNHPKSESSKCPPSRAIKRNMFHNQFLTTDNRAREGLKYVMATNFPNLPPDSPTGSPPMKHEIHDVCGRKTHHPKLRTRDLGKALCEAPSMTQELDDLYKEYIQRCPEGNEKSEACRFLHHAPSPHHREPRRSILKDQPIFGLEFQHQQQQQRRSSDKGHLVHFDKNVDICTAITKVNGIDASLRETNGRLKLLRQLGGRITETGTQGESVQEKYPLHIRDPKKTIPQSGPLDWLKSSDQEELEEKAAKQDLARIYFTTEAARLIACANLASLDRNTSMFRKTDLSRRPPFPHFFMDRLANDVEAENKRKKQDRISLVKNEMDAFDESVKERPPLKTATTFDPSQPPSEKSLNDLKLKIEIMKRQRERDVQAAAERNRTRKSYFRQMLPCFSDVIRNGLMEYSIKMASKLSGEEKMLARDFLMVANQRNVFQEHRQEYDEEEELMTEEGEESVGGNEKMIREILDVCVDVVVKVCNYKTTTGKEPSDSLRREWRDTGFSLLNRHDANEDQIEPIADTICGEGTSEDDTGSPGQLRRLSELSNETMDETRDSISGRDDGDDNRTRCIVAISTVKEPISDTVPTDEKPATSVQVHITDCLHEDLESALTYDGLFLPVTESYLTHSSSETQTESSATPSVTPTDSPDESFTDCTNVQQVDPKQQLDGFDYDEYEGEDEEYFDEGNRVIPVGMTNELGGNNAIRIELTEETATEGDDGARVGEVEVQAIDSEGESPDGGKQKGKGLQFNEVVDKRPASAGEYATKEKSGRESKVSLKDSIKFDLPEDFVSKRKPVQRKHTAFRPKNSIDDDMDDDDDDNDHENLDDDDDQQNSELRYSLFQGEDEGGIRGEQEENSREGEEEGSEHEVGSGKSDLDSQSKVPCSGRPSRRKILVYEELGSISYGMKCPEHEERFLKHRYEELKQFSETWGKGLYKPPRVFTIHEKNIVPLSNQFTGKRMPPFNILDPHIPRPKFNLRVKSLIRKAEQAKLEKIKCAEDGLKEEIKQNNENGQMAVAESVKRTCSEMLKGKPKKRPSWQDEIAEYECRRKEREKLLAETEVDDDYAKKLGFDVFHNDSSLRQTFYGHPHDQIPDHFENAEDQGSTQRRSSFGRNKSVACVSGPDGTLTDVCEVDGDDGENLEEEDYEVANCDEEEACQILATKYLEFPGEGMYEDNFDFPHEEHDRVAEEEIFSIPETYNE